MDSSTRLNFVLGDLKVTAKEIQPEEWLKIIDRALDICKPWLKYLPRFRPLGQYLNPGDTIDGYIVRENDVSIMEFSQGIDQKTICVQVASISHECEGQCVDPAGGVRFVNKEDLFLSRDGIWLYWQHRHERIPIYYGNKKRIHEIGRTCKFTLWSESDLLACIRKDDIVATKIFATLLEIIEEGVREREVRLDGMKKVRDRMKNIRYRIDSIF